MKFLTYLTLGVALLIGNLQLQAQQIGLEYNTELQTNFRGDYNWVNMLRLDGAVDLSKTFTLELATISIAKTEAEPIISDLQGFSNIEEENLALGIAKLGAEFRHRRSTFFLGIRNVNEDYFTSPLTSLFLNSSCGIFPTIAGNYDIANYPLSSWCFHYRAQWDNISLQTSLYEGLGHCRIAGHDNVFKFSPKHDGIFSITSAEYDKNGSNYSVGCALYYGVHNYDEVSLASATSEAEAQAPSASQKRRVSVAPWVNVEQRLTDRCRLMLQASYSTVRDYCRYYGGIGAGYDIGRASMGLFANYARYHDNKEIVTELTCNVAITDHIALQPALELIKTDSQSLNTIGLLRLQIKL